MATADELKAALASDRSRPVLARLYGNAPSSRDAQIGRYTALMDRFSAAFPRCGDLGLFSAPGRTEIGGNHTDHNAGQVLAAAVDLDIIAAAARTPDRTIVIESEGYPTQTVSLDELGPREEERFTTAAITRGVCAGLRQRGREVGGFRACMSSAVPMGSGLSSSAAYEVLTAVILSCLYNRGDIPPIEIAQAAQFAENSYFGKPCGLMDQTASAVGGFVAIDFRDPARPVVRKLAVDFAATGFAMVIVSTGGSHADLNEEYAAIAHEMKAVAKALGGSVLRDVTREAVLAGLAGLRTVAGDRAILRALHYFDENRRVGGQVAALEEGRFGEFLRLVVESGHSSWMLCQNCYASAGEQGIPIALAVSEHILGTRGAWRVHGGGFAGTILAFVPHDLLERYLRELRTVFGAESCRSLTIRQPGAGPVRLE
jgi:galactokinase